MENAPEGLLFAPGDRAVYMGQGLVTVQCVERVMGLPMYVLRTQDAPSATIRAPVGSPHLAVGARSDRCRLHCAAAPGAVGEGGLRESLPS
jgi:hypothetical protein